LDIGRPDGRDGAGESPAAAECGAFEERGDGNLFIPVRDKKNGRASI
jgi:hypothetical protein